jgi:hypothetical protein
MPEPQHLLAFGGGAAGAGEENRVLSEWGKRLPAATVSALGAAASAPEALRRPLPSLTLQASQLLVPEPKRLLALRPVVVQVVGP